MHTLAHTHYFGISVIPKPPFHPFEIAIPHNQLIASGNSGYLQTYHVSDEILDWLLTNAIEHELVERSATYYYEHYGAKQVSLLKMHAIVFEKSDDAMIFKLTWC